MTQTRGSNIVNALHTSRASSKRLLAQEVDSFLRAHFQDIDPPLEDLFYEALTSEILGQYILSNHGAFVFRSKDEHNKSKNKVVRAAKSLRARLTELIYLSDNIGMDTLECWRSEFGGAKNEPLAILLDMLSALENFDEKYLYKSNITQIYRKFIKKTFQIFESHLMPTALHENSEFFLFLVELERVLPNMVFPTQSVPSGRLDYIREALGRRNRA